MFRYRIDPEIIGIRIDTPRDEDFLTPKPIMQYDPAGDYVRWCDVSSQLPGRFEDLTRIALCAAREEHPALCSLHEAYARILEELEEFKGQVFRKPRNRIIELAIEELTHVAATCQRTAEDLLFSRESPP